jgi:NAD+ diphosphatase
MECPTCGSIFYPAIAPAVIVAIVCDEEILLVRGGRSINGRYSLVSGFVEVGETLEEAVVREVKEETGLDVHAIRYYKNQPWPLSSSMMVGFIAEADRNQPLVLDCNELSHAGWFTKDNLPNHSLSLSIAGEMIEQFGKGKLL